MSVEVDLGGDPDALRSVTFADAELPIGRYCFSVGAGGTLIILVDERGESRIDRVYSPAAWHGVRGDVWRKGMLLG
jgi:hypothetical protein